MKQKIASVVVISSLIFSQASFVFAQVPEAPMETAPEPAEPVAPADTTPPVISEVSAMSLGLNEVTIAWTTDEPAISRLRYGETNALGSEVPLDPSALLVHAAVIPNLSAGTTYHYCIDATDAEGNTGESCGHTFTTEPAEIPIDTAPPVVTEVTLTDMTTTGITIGWTTDEVGNGYIEYGTTENYGEVTPLTTALSMEHEVTLSGLSPDTEYHYRIVSSDEAGNAIETPDNTFTTEPLPTVEPPVEETPPPAEPTSTPITEPVATTTPTTEPTATTTPTTTPTATTTPIALLFHSIEADKIASTSVTIHWETNLPADSLVQYGFTPELGFESTHATALTSIHEMPISGLAPDTRYYFRVVSKPSSATTATVSELHEFTTLVVPIIIDPAADITSLTTSSLTSTGFTVQWTTNESTLGTIEYGTTTAYGESHALEASSASHTKNISGLTPDTTYHFRVKAVDAGGNETYSIDRKIRTPAVASSGGGSGTTTPVATEPPTATSTPTNAPEPEATTTPIVAKPEAVPTPAPVPAPVSSGGGGGGGTYVQPPGTPLLVTAAPADSEIMFQWQNPGTAGLSGVKLVRKAGGYPASPSDGSVVYSGNAETFTDTELQNGTTYHYALYAHNIYGQHSESVPISLAPVAGVEEVKIEKVPVLIPDTVVEHFSETHSFGDRGEEIIHLQQILNIEGVHESGLTTGYFGPLTKASLLEFQDKHDLPQTAVTDAATREKLNTISAGHVDMELPGTIAILEKDLSRGAQGEIVKHLQEFLVYEGSYPEALTTGYFGPLTQAAVARFQTKYGVTPTVGYVGPKTRHTMQTVLGL
ncbi:MAG: fibronectin type III domain-containing protein [Patescibacteria group bacterium]|nr:fibronectin type III domain-containing protein [Patescibacteria group bacterium]